MLLSYKKSFLFVHNPKAAGRSVKHQLGQYSLYSPSKFHSLNKIIENINPGILSFENHKNNFFRNNINRRFFFDGHHTAAQIKKRFKNSEWDKLFKFGFVRNPWSREVSLYFFIKQNLAQHPEYEFINKFNSFKCYLDWTLQNKPLRFQKDYFCDSNGELIVDYIGKIETYDKDMSIVLDKIGIKKMQSTNENQSKHNDFREYYDNESFDWIKSMYHRDITFFNYS